jgi:imidazolonepropionase-like amidohydrolase
MAIDAALVGGTIYVDPAQEPIRDGAVLIDGDKIAVVGDRASVQVPEGAELLDCSGKMITAGFWNSHVHFFERKWSDAASIPAVELERQLQDYARFGFTSVFDLGSMWTNAKTIRDRIDSGQVRGPRIRSTGEGLMPPGALPSDQILAFMGFAKFPAPEITDPAQAASAARTLVEQGVDGIKLFASSPRSAPLPQAAIETAVRVAHAANKPVFLHPNSGADVLAAVFGGVDIIAHTTPHSGLWDESLIDEMKERGVALTPTLNVWKYFIRHDRVSTQDRVVDTAAAQLRSWLDAGGTVLFGTDVGAVECDPSEEYALMAGAGMSGLQILTSLTTAPADRFGEASRLGRIAQGLQADLVVLERDPRQDPLALTSVQYTLRSGKVIYRRPAASSENP